MFYKNGDIVKYKYKVKVFSIEIWGGGEENTRLPSMKGGIRYVNTST